MRKWIFAGGQEGRSGRNGARVPNQGYTGFPASRVVHCEDTIQGHLASRMRGTTEVRQVYDRTQALIRIGLRRSGYFGGRAHNIIGLSTYGQQSGSAWQWYLSYGVPASELKADYKSPVGSNVVCSAKPERVGRALGEMSWKLHY